MSHGQRVMATCLRHMLSIHRLCQPIHGVQHAEIKVKHCHHLLAEARKLTASKEILLWITPSEFPKALQASECSELLDPLRASCWISAQH